MTIVIILSVWNVGLQQQVQAAHSGWGGWQQLRAQHSALHSTEMHLLPSEDAKR
jgi:hypothetical protein